MFALYGAETVKMLQLHCENEIIESTKTYLPLTGGNELGGLSKHSGSQWDSGRQRVKAALVKLGMLAYVQEVSANTDNVVTSSQHATLK